MLKKYYLIALINSLIFVGLALLLYYTKAHELLKSLLPVGVTFIVTLSWLGVDDMINKKSRALARLIEINNMIKYAENKGGELDNRLLKAGTKSWAQHSCFQETEILFGKYKKEIARLLKVIKYKPPILSLRDFLIQQQEIEKHVLLQQKAIKSFNGEDNAPIAP